MVIFHKNFNKILINRKIKENFYVCPESNYHFRIGSKEYFEILFDDNKFVEINMNLESLDFLQFFDNQSYTKKIYDTKKKKINSSIRTAFGKLNKIDILISCMDFNFIGGTMGSVMGEKIFRSINYSIEKNIPFLLISKSGGVRIMESSVSLMQMAKTSAKIYKLLENKIPYISLLTDPTMGGVFSSFSMIGDFNIAEPNALIGFSGPKIIQETLNENFSKNFQNSEFLFQNGFLDFLIDRRFLKSKISLLLNMLM